MVFAICLKYKHVIITLPNSEVIIAPEQDATICWKGVRPSVATRELFWETISTPVMYFKVPIIKYFLVFRSSIKNSHVSNMNIIKLSHLPWTLFKKTHMFVMHTVIQEHSPGYIDYHQLSTTLPHYWVFKERQQQMLHKTDKNCTMSSVLILLVKYRVKNKLTWFAWNFMLLRWCAPLGLHNAWRACRCLVIHSSTFVNASFLNFVIWHKCSRLWNCIELLCPINISLKLYFLNKGNNRHMRTIVAQCLTFLKICFNKLTSNICRIYLCELPGWHQALWRSGKIERARVECLLWRCL